MSERRHRIQSIELEPVKEAIYQDLIRRLESKEDLYSAACLFRFWYRLENHITSKPIYPPHDSWDQIRAYIFNGTINEEPEKPEYGTIKPREDKQPRNGTESQPRMSYLDLVVQNALRDKETSLG